MRPPPLCFNWRQGPGHWGQRRDASFGVEKAVVSVKKPGALKGKNASYAAIEVTRVKKALAQAFIALGSNISNREKNIDANTTLAPEFLDILNPREYIKFAKKGVRVLRNLLSEVKQ